MVPVGPLETAKGVLPDCIPCDAEETVRAASACRRVASAEAGNHEYSPDIKMPLHKYATAWGLGYGECVWFCFIRGALLLCKWLRRRGGLRLCRLWYRQMFYRQIVHRAILQS